MDISFDEFRKMIDIAEHHKACEIDLNILRQFKSVENFIKSPNAPFWTYWYAENVLKGRFELGESIIARDAQNSLYYAENVLKGRFALGEPAIATDAVYSYDYANYVLKGRFEAGEEEIATSDSYSYLYAKNVLKGRFELAEAIIKKEKYLETLYKEFLESLDTP